MQYWLMKSEPDEFSIDDLAAAPDQRTSWFGVRNYQARNFMRDQMRLGDLAFFYHSGCAEPGIAGICEVCALAHPDETQFDPSSPYHDPKATRDQPRWLNVDVRLKKRTLYISLSELRCHAELGGMVLLRRGNRLSITPVTSGEWQFITRVLMGSSGESKDR
jgi:predicted RNA-binding protein with PUA-like domain